MAHSHSCKTLIQSKLKAALEHLKYNFWSLLVLVSFNSKHLILHKYMMQFIKTSMAHKLD